MTEIYATNKTKKYWSNIQLLLFFLFSFLLILFKMSLINSNFCWLYQILWSSQLTQAIFALLGDITSCFSFPEVTAQIWLGKALLFLFFCFNIVPNNGSGNKNKNDSIINAFYMLRMRLSLYLLSNYHHQELMSIIILPLSFP